MHLLVLVLCTHNNEAHKCIYICVLHLLKHTNTNTHAQNYKHTRTKL